MTFDRRVPYSMPLGTQECSLPAPAAAVLPVQKEKPVLSAEYRFLPKYLILPMGQTVSSPYFPRRGFFPPGSPWSIP